jgi:hypothetical protein
MAVQHSTGRRNPGVNGAVDAPGRRIRGSGAIHRERVVCIKEQKLTGLHQAEMPPPRVGQEPTTVSRHRSTEVIGYRFVEVHFCGEPERSGKVNANLGLVEFGSGHPAIAATEIDLFTMKFLLRFNDQRG